MALRLYNTLSRKKEPFQPIDAGNVRMYVCGPTVYDFAHIGNARPVIVFDVLFRLLRHLYGADHVTYVRNITDVDDKINARAAELGISIRELTEKTYRRFRRDCKALRCLPPTFEPRATEFVSRSDGKTDMISLIQSILDAGFAYEESGHVLFDVSKKSDYGKLSNRSLDEMIAGARVEVAPYKRGPMDFVLWKPSGPAEPGWMSPWGFGRPGWHIECSAMSEAYLGKTFDIHGGGIDLIFPHHENEIAQSEAAHGGRQFVCTWMHNGFLQVEGQKMAKSLGNFVTIHELRRTKRFGGRSWSGDVLRVAMLQTHYRQPIDWSVRALEQSEARLNNWNSFAAERTSRKINERLRQGFIEALEDDLNTPAAFTLLDRVCSSEWSDERDRYTVFRLLKFLGLRTTKTTVAKAAEPLAVAARSVSKIPETGWVQILQQIAKPTESRPQAVEFVASVQAIAQLEEVLKQTISSDSFRSINTYRAHEPLFAQHALSLVPLVDEGASKHWVSQNVLRSFRSAFRNISKLSVHDWQNLAENVRRSPTFLSGKPKPEAMLFVYLVDFDRFGRQLSAQMGDDVRAQIQEQFQKYLCQITPQRSRQEHEIDALVAARHAARKAKNFAEADRIRDELAAMGIELKDAKDPKTGELVTTWEVAR